MWKYQLQSFLKAVSVAVLFSIHTVSASSQFQNNNNGPSPVPLIDLASHDEDQLAKEISLACSTLGFFQVTSHGIPQELLDRFRNQCALYFDQTSKIKQNWKRNGANSRGFFDDELTKQRRDWKEALDVGVPGSRNWKLEDENELNACLDGFNQFPTKEELPHFRDTIVEYFEACATLSDRIAGLMARGMGLPSNDPFIRDLKEQHSSYLRMNYYPPCDPSQTTNVKNNDPLGISPHKDAGFLTVLMQDDDCHSLQAEIEGEWVSVNPTPGALTINTGDMAQVWSNGKYKAPLHRVLTSPHQKRYSAPFFYNPGYSLFVEPLTTTIKTTTIPDKYIPVLWGYFRAIRFAGDLTDLGVEIQIEDFEKANKVPSAHLARQEAFHREGWIEKAFDVNAYKELLQTFPDDE